MPVTLSNGSVAAIIIIVVSAGIAVGIIHDQSIKGVYSSFSSQVSALQEQTKFTFVQGTVYYHRFLSCWLDHHRTTPAALIEALTLQAVLTGLADAIASTLLRLVLRMNEEWLSAYRVSLR